MHGVAGLSSAPNTIGPIIADNVKDPELIAIIPSHPLWRLFSQPKSLWDVKHHKPTEYHLQLLAHKVLKHFKALEQYHWCITLYIKEAKE